MKPRPISKPAGAQPVLYDRRTETSRMPEDGQGTSRKPVSPGATSRDAEYSHVSWPSSTTWHRNSRSDVDVNVMWLRTVTPEYEGATVTGA